jgi:hypothetical protein
MSVSLNTFVQILIISFFIYIFVWNMPQLKEGLEEKKKEVLIDEENEIIDKKTGLKRNLTDEEKVEIREKQKAGEKKSTDDMNERFNSYKG